MNYLRIVVHVLVMCLLVAAIWLSFWLHDNRVFADPTALEAKDALAAQAAWAQAILSVLAVLAAVWVAKVQADQSKALIKSELDRTRSKELKESSERQYLARTSLDDIFSKFDEIKVALNEGDSESWSVALSTLESSAKNAQDDFARVSPVLKQTPAGSLHCFYIEESLAKLARPRDTIFASLLTMRFGVQTIKEYASADVAKDVWTAIEKESDELLQHVKSM